MSAQCVWYLELRGPTAATVLSDFLEKLAQQPGFVGAELQTSPAQPELALIASRWAQPPPTLPVPAGAKHWRFEIMLAL